jgi:hypothetical protein
MAGGATSPPIFLAAFKMVVPGATSMVMLSMVTLNGAGASFFISSLIFDFTILRLKQRKNAKFYKLSIFNLRLKSDYFLFSLLCRSQLMLF